MPAEKVYGLQTSRQEQGDTPMVPLVDVRWNREGGYVQIVTKAQDPHGGRLAGDDPIPTLRMACTSISAGTRSTS